MEQIPSHPPLEYEADATSVDETTGLLASRSIQESTDGAGVREREAGTIQLQAPPKGAK